MTELDSFVHKFHHLWRSGLTAHLNLETHAGEAWASIRVQLGHDPGRQHQQVHDPFQHRHRGPAYYRRQAKRKAARTAAAGSAAPAVPSSHFSVRNSEDIPAAKAAPAFSVDNNSEEEHTVVEGDMPAVEADKIVNNNFEAGVDEVTFVEERPAIAEKVNSFACEICEFESKWENGLNIHMSKKHAPIEQLDGGDDAEGQKVDEKYRRSEHYWREGWIGITYSVYLDAVEVLDTCNDISEEEKRTELLKLLEARKRAFGSNFKHFPPWKEKSWSSL